MKKIVLLVGCLVLAGCAKGQGISLMPFEDPRAEPTNFVLCHGFGCSHRSRVHLSEAQWARAVAPLKRGAKSAAQERVNIAKSVALIEKAVQKETGLSPDLGGARTFEKDQHQMDCLDETINTSRYLAFIADSGLLKYNDAVDPIHRGYFVDGMWPHNSAAVRDNATGVIYAIDSYYSDNGGPVYVVDLDTWLDEWRPEGYAKDEPVPKPKRKPRRG